MKRVLWLGLLALAMMGSCRVNDDVDLLAGEWRVLRIQPLGEPSQNTAAMYIIRFKADGTISLKLDVNQCFGAYSTPEAGQISVSSLGCTEICCDSAFAQRLSLILRSASNFQFEGRKLTLIGPNGVIEAQRMGR